MHRISVDELTNSDASWRVFTGYLEKLIGDTWEISPTENHDNVVVSWSVPGANDDTIPTITVEADNALFPADQSNFNPPNKIEIDLTDVNILKLPPSVVVTIIDDTTDLPVIDAASVSLDDYVQIGCGSLVGYHTIMLMPVVRHVFYESHLTDNVLELSGIYHVLGLLKNDDAIVYPVDHVAYASNTTFIDLTDCGDIEGTLLLSPTIMVTTSLAPSTIMMNIAYRYPFAICNEDSELVSTWQLFTSFNTLIDVNAVPNQFSILMPTWISDAISPTLPEDIITVQVDAFVNLTEQSDTVHRPTTVVTTGRVYRMSNLGWIIAVNDDALCAVHELWMAIGTSIADVGITSCGVVFNTSWNWTTVGAPLYLTGSGELTETEPTFGIDPNKVHRIVGYVRGTNHVRFTGHQTGYVLTS